MRYIALLACSLLLLVPAALPVRASETRPQGQWPLRPRPEVVRVFDPPEVRWGSGHRGVDLRGSVGAPVRAALAGKVSFVGTIAGVGVVVVDHGATRTTYQPVEASVRVGRQVDAGTVLGALRWYGSHCAPAACLHWGLVRGETYLDPLVLVDAPSPVSLLPLGPTAATAPGPASPSVPLSPGRTPDPTLTRVPTLMPFPALTPWS